MEIQEIKELIDYCETKELAYFEIVKGGTKLVFAKEGYHPEVCKDFSNKNLTHIEALSLEEAATKELAGETLKAKENPDIKNGENSIEYDKEIIQIRSPFVGIVNISEKIIKGDHNVNAKDVLCFIEAMKIYNDIHSPVTGNIKKIYVDDKSILEYDQLIMDIEVDKL